MPGQQARDGRPAPLGAFAGALLVLKTSGGRGLLGTPRSCPSPVTPARVVKARALRSCRLASNARSGSLRC
ncbi:hypothetical protein ACIOHO_38820 [Streptomyces sp. NPDC087849]|uniref:hypothetical protein n=1 Tax=Streptomyces sp. NPDC087849 TaxID=3365808 RepID=UPI0038300867